jgi:hypothetical protein
MKSLRQILREELEKYDVTKDPMAIELINYLNDNFDDREYGLSNIEVYGEDPNGLHGYGFLDQRNHQGYRYFNVGTKQTWIDFIKNGLQFRDFNNYFDKRLEKMDKYYVNIILGSGKNNTE